MRGMVRREALRKAGVRLLEGHPVSVGGALVRSILDVPAGPSKAPDTDR